MTQAQLAARAGQLTRYAYGTLAAGLSAPQRASLVDAEDGRVGGRAKVLAALRRKGLVQAESLTVLGWRLRAGLLAPPGSFASTVAQTLMDGGLEWQDLSGGTLDVPSFRVDSWDGRECACVTVRGLDGAASVVGTEEAERLLRAAGCDVVRTAGRSPRLLVSAEGEA